MKDRLFSQLLGQAKAIASHFFRRSIGKDPVDPDSSVDYSSDFLQMMFSGDGFQLDEDVPGRSMFSSSFMLTMSKTVQLLLLGLLAISS